jgi:hypothetical protein
VVTPKQRQPRNLEVLPTWCHAIEEPIPSHFMNKSLDGNQGKLADWICPVFGFEANRRHLHYLAEVGLVWIVKAPRHQPCMVYFRDQDQPKYAKANANYLAAMETKQKQT